jgi:hypothetical protein
MAGGRVNREAGWRGYGREVLVLENERERNGGGRNRAGWLMLWNTDRHALALGQKPGSASRFSIYCNPLIRHQAGGLGA